jgi:hypothetical protein
MSDIDTKNLETQNQAIPKEPPAMIAMAEETRRHDTLHGDFVLRAQDSRRNPEEKNTAPKSNADTTFRDAFIKGTLNSLPPQLSVQRNHVIDYEMPAAQRRTTPPPYETLAEAETRESAHLPLAKGIYYERAAGEGEHYRADWIREKQHFEIMGLRTHVGVTRDELKHEKSDAPSHVEISHEDEGATATPAIEPADASPSEGEGHGALSHTWGIEARLEFARVSLWQGHVSVGVKTGFTPDEVILPQLSLHFHPNETAEGKFDPPGLSRRAPGERKPGH